MERRARRARRAQARPALVSATVVAWVFAGLLGVLLAAQGAGAQEECSPSCGAIIPIHGGSLLA